MGSPLVINLQRDKSTNNPQAGGREKAEFKVNRGQRTGMPGPAHRLRRLKQEGTHLPAYLGPGQNWDCLHPSSDASMFHKGQLGRCEGGQGKHLCRGRHLCRLSPISADVHPSALSPSPRLSVLPRAAVCPGESSAPLGCLVTGKGL